MNTDAHAVDQQKNLCVKCGGERLTASILIMDASDEEAEQYLAQFDKCENCGEYLALDNKKSGSITLQF